MALYTYNNLSSQFQGQIQNLVNGVRSLEIQIYNVATQAQAFVQIWNGNPSVSGLIGMISNLDQIPNTSNLAGAYQLTPLDFTNNHMAYLTTIAGFADAAHVTEFAGAAGPTNIHS